jgi:NTE family protein
MGTTESKRQVSRAQWLRKLASRRADRTAFVLSGGGPYGALQVGALRALLEAGVRPDLVVGTSVGSMNGAFIAVDPTLAGIERLTRIWMGFGDADLFPGGRFKTAWARMLMRGNRVFENSGLLRMIETNLGQPTFEDTQIPLAVVAADLDTGAERVFTTGDLVQPLLASSAMPGVYPPVAIDGSLYIDGGVANSVPIAPAVSMGAKKLYVIDVSGTNHMRRPLLRPMDYLLHAFSLSRSKRLELDIEHFKDRVELVFVPVPRLDFVVPFASMEHTPRLIEMGYEHARRFFEREASTTASEVVPGPDSALPAT